MKPNTSRKVFDWLKRMVMALILLIGFFATAGMIYQTAATEADQRKYQPPGLLVNVGEYKMHIYCQGEGGPTVILDSANMGTVSTWAWIQPQIVKETRVCAYDRADSGWSDLSPQPNDTRHNAQALHTLLNHANVPGP